MKRLLYAVAGCVVIGLTIMVILNPMPKSDRICILKFATHAALDQTEAGVLESLEKAIASKSLPLNIRIERFNADNQSAEVKRLAEACSTSDTLAIITIATPAAQAVIRTDSKIPLIYGAVSDPEGAGLANSNRATGIKNVGPETIVTALDFIQKAFPLVKKIGSLYNPAEQNSQYVQKLISNECKKRKLQFVPRSVSSASELGATVEVLLDEVDLLYSANDNLVNSGAILVSEICAEKQKPFVIGDLSTFSAGAAIAIGLDYHSVGIDLGNMAVKVINNKDTASVPPLGPPPPSILVSKDVLKRIGLEMNPEATQMVTKQKDGERK